jgi:hypothetical protein
VNDAATLAARLGALPTELGDAVSVGVAAAIGAGT